MLARGCQATAARTACATCSYYCTKSNRFRDVMEEAVRGGAGLCRARVLHLTVPVVLRSVRMVRPFGDELAVDAAAAVVVIVVTAAQV